MQVTVCGGGNAAHTLVGLLASQSSNRVNVYLSWESEVQRWRAGIASEGGIAVLYRGETTLGRPNLISSDPSVVLPGSDLVLLAVPAFAHEAILSQISPFLDDEAWLGAIPARGCFDLCVWDALREKGASLTIFGLQSLPWACRILEYGRSVQVLGNKARLDLAVWPTANTVIMAKQLSELLGIRLDPAPDFLNITLGNTGQLIHPGILYGRFRDWDGRPLTVAPLFYQGVDADTAAILEAMSAEIQELRRALQERLPLRGLSAIRPLSEWLQRSYPDDILDFSNLQAMFNSNRSYAGLRVPVRPDTSGYQPGGVQPDFQSRYLSEDIPYGLISTRGIAELAGVDTPIIDRVILWAQNRLNQEYLVSGKLRGRHLAATRAPQRYGFNSLEQLTDRIGLAA
jgi:hypothetical protein